MSLKQLVIVIRMQPVLLTVGHLMEGSVNGCPCHHHFQSFTELLTFRLHSDNISHRPGLLAYIIHISHDISPASTTPDQGLIYKKKILR